MSRNNSFSENENMTARYPEIGTAIWDLDTPALLLDFPTMENNLYKMADFFTGKPVRPRPHVKLHNATPQLAQLQLEAGAIGLTCAKLSEAETLAHAGFLDILIANQIVGQKKIRRLVELTRITDIMVAVDSPANVQQLSDAAQAYGTTIRVLVEINIGHNRCGVAPFEPAFDLCQEVIQSPGLKFSGLMGYDGHCTLKINPAEREEASEKSNQLLADTRKFIEEKGVEVPIVSASGTFTYKYASGIKGITEIQAGTYLLMDTAVQEAGVEEFDCALSVLTSVISRPMYPQDIELAIIDIGRKGISPILGMPAVLNPDGADLFSLSQEHGRVALDNIDRAIQVGEKMLLSVRDANGTIMLFDRFHIVRDEIVVDVWQIPICGNRR
jgi:D-serine deaminase-like pyridoxal phosphate-dependent protein